MVRFAVGFTFRSWAWGNMALRDYERLAGEASGLIHPENLPRGTTADDFLTVGEVDIEGLADAVEAIGRRRLERVRKVVATLEAEGFTDEARTVAEKTDFLSLTEYLATLARMDDIKKRTEQLADLERKKAFDRTYKDGKPSFYPTYDPPTKNELTLYRLALATPLEQNLAGYVAYIKAIHPSLSRLFFLKLPALIPEKDRELHTYITGSSGAGKSEIMKVLIHAYVTKKKPPCIVVIDPHGKFADEVARQKEVVESGRLIYLNPAFSKKWTPTINPFECDEPERAEYIGKGLIGLFELLFMQENSAELSGNMRVILNAFIPALLRMPDTDILTLQKLLGADDTSPLFRKALANMEPQQRDFIRSEWSKKSFETTKDSLRKKIQTIASTPFLRFACGHNTIDLDDAVKKRSVICLSLSKSDLDTGTIKAMGAFFLATVQAYAYAKSHERPESDPNRVPIHCFIDECHNFVSPTFTEILTEGRKFGLHLTLAQQFASQGMEDNDLKKAVLGTTGIKIAGYNNEKATQKAMAREMQLDEAELISLPKHRFWVKSTDKKPFKLIPPSNLIGNRNCVDGETWFRVIGDQLGRFYRPVESSKTATEGKPPPDATNAPDAPPDAFPSDFIEPPPPDFR